MMILSSKRNIKTVQCKLYDSQFLSSIFGRIGNIVVIPHFVVQKVQCHISPSQPKIHDGSLIPREVPELLGYSSLIRSQCFVSHPTRVLFKNCISCAIYVAVGSCCDHNDFASLFHEFFLCLDNFFCKVNPKLKWSQP